jgi:molecular chaperone GrpE
MKKEDKPSGDELMENSKAADENINFEDQIAKLQEDIRGLNDTLLRKTAESENLRKRLEKEKEDAIKYSNTKFARDLLSVVDNFERVTKNSSLFEEKIETDTNLQALLEGILLCGKELISVFKKHGISKVEIQEGDKFNPEYHQAMCELSSKDHESGSIINVLQTGYIYHDRLLRPAMVSVSKKHE